MTETGSTPSTANVGFILRCSVVCAGRLSKAHKDKEKEKEKGRDKETHRREEREKERERSHRDDVKHRSSDAERGKEDRKRKHRESSPDRYVYSRTHNDGPSPRQWGASYSCHNRNRVRSCDFRLEKIISSRSDKDSGSSYMQQNVLATV